MPKPSIFSRDYDERMRKRKKRKRLVLWGIILLLILIFIFSGAINSITGGNTLGINKLGEKITTLINTKIFTREKDKKGNIDNDSKDIKEAPKKGEVKPSKESDGDNTSADKSKIKPDTNQAGEQILKLSNGEEVKVQYIIKNNERQYTGILPKTIKYDISPSKRTIALIENVTQNMILIDNNGNKKDITKKQYVSSKGNTFDKDKVLQQNKNYVWCDSPKFLNEDEILYVSQLPWFNKNSIKFLWKYTISSNKHKHNLLPQGGEIEGKDIVYGNITSEGIEILVDGKHIIIK